MAYKKSNKIWNRAWVQRLFFGVLFIVFSYWLKLHDGELFSWLLAFIVTGWLVTFCFFIITPYDWKNPSGGGPCMF